MMTTAYLTDDRLHIHTLPGHPERADRLIAVQRRLEESGVAARMMRLKPEVVTDKQILSVHTQEYLNDVLRWSESQRGVMVGADTYLLPRSLWAARLSAGACLRAVDAVMSNEAHNALVCARPPGHHAVPDMAMGFCLLANVALAARHAQTEYRAKRVLIVDYDVHHGNGTQDIFYQDPDILFISTHQSPWYPGTGLIEETGSGAGRGTTLNIPLEAGVNDIGFAAIYAQVVWPAVQRFRPDLILVSAGFDAHWADPLGQMGLTLKGYAHLTRELIRMAEEMCGGRIVFVLEGGYNLESLSHGVLNVAYALLGDQTVSDPIGATNRFIPDTAHLIARLRRIHSL